MEVLNEIQMAFELFGDVVLGLVLLAGVIGFAAGSLK